MRGRKLWIDRGSRFLVWIGLLLLAFALMRALSVGALGGGKFDGFKTALLAGFGLACICAFAAVWTRLHWRELPEVEHRRPKSSTIPSAAGLRLDAFSTLLMVARTTRHLARVNDSIAVRDGYYERKISTEWVLPTQRDPDCDHNVYLIPVARALRSKTVDNLVFEDASGTRISTCNTNEYVAVLGALLTRVTQTLSGATQWTAKRATFETLIEKLIGDLRFDARSADNDITGETQTAEPKSVASFIAELRKLNQPSEWATKKNWNVWIEVTCAFCESLTGSYISFVPVSGEPGDRVTVQYSYTHRNRPERSKLIDKVRWFFGLRPHEHEFRVFGHAFTPSYHLTFRPPSDQYVYTTAVTRTGTYQGESVVSQPYVGAGARDYAHIWVRPSEAESNERRANLHLKFDCREKPPGLLGVVTLVAISQFAFIWVIGKFYGQFFPDVSSDALAAIHAGCRAATHGATEAIRQAGLKACTASSPSRSLSTDVPALLLALPGAAAAWLGAQFTSERLRSTSLATVIGVSVCGLIAVISTAAAMTRSAGHLVGEQLGLKHAIWAGLMALSFILAVDLLVRTIVRALRFARRLNLPDDETSILV